MNVDDVAFVAFLRQKIAQILGHFIEDKRLSPILNTCPLTEGGKDDSHLIFFPFIRMSFSPSLRSRSTAGLAVFALSVTLGALVPALSAPQTADAQTCTPVSTANLTGYWTLNENAPATVAQDSTGGNNGTYNGPTRSSGTTVISPNAAARMFDGVNDYISVNNSNDFTFGNTSFTVSLFLKTGSGNRAVLGNFNGSNRGWGLYAYPNQVDFFGYGNQGINDAPKGAANLTNDQWHHVAGVYSRSGSSLKIDSYVDGTLVGTQTATVGNITSSSPLHFGHYLGQPYFEGGLDDIRIYGRTLSAAEISSLASGCGNASSSSSSSVSSGTGSSMSSSSSISSSGSSLSSSLSSTGSSLSSSSSVSSVCQPVTLSGLSAYWKMDGSGSTIQDSTTFNNSGTLLNGAMQTASGAPVNYMNPRSLWLDGTNDYALVPNTTNFPSGNAARTISLWMRQEALTSQAALVSLGNGNTASQKFIVMMGSEGGQTYLFTDGVNESNNITLSGSQIPTTGAWHHVAFVTDGSAWQYYLDGTLRKSGTFAVALNTVTNDVEIGARHDIATGYFDGMLDEVRIYNRALTAAEVAAFAQGCGNTGQGSSSSSSTSSSSSSTSSTSSSSSVSSGSTVPTCEGMAATIYVRNGKVVGGTSSGQTFNGMLNGTNQADVIVGTNGSDYIRGFQGADHICGRDGNDYIRGDQGDDVIRGGAGSDLVYGDEGTDTVSGNADSDRLFGGNGADILCGQGGSDFLSGQNAVDRLDGGASTDFLSGGAGANTCANGESNSGCTSIVSSIPECSNNNQ